MCHRAGSTVDAKINIGPHSARGLYVSPAIDTILRELGVPDATCGHKRPGHAMFDGFMIKSYSRAQFDQAN